MKRTLSLLAALLIVVSSAGTVMAADKTLNSSTTTGTADLAYDVSSTYTVTIPATISITGATPTGTLTIGATNVCIAEGEKLRVKITKAENYVEGTPFRLKTGSNTYLPYEITKSGNNITYGGEVLYVEAGATDGSAGLTITPNTATVSGSYADELTFTVSVGT